MKAGGGTPATREDAVDFAVGAIMRSKDWQDVQNEMANDDRVRAWVDQESGGNDDASLSVCQSVISEAEERLGDEMPSDYA